MNNKVKIKVLSDSYFIKYLINHNIKYSNLKRIDNSYYLIVSINDYKSISKLYETYLIRYYGINYIKYILKLHKYLIVSFILCLFLLNMLCNTIFEIEVNTNNEELKHNILNILNKYDINIYKKKKNYEEIEIIKENILNEVDNIEWIEISNIGCKYIIDINEKITKINESNNSKSDIIASKDGLIKHIVVYNGTKIKEENEYVNKGEVLISGSVYKDENLINYENALGEVYAETWYLTKVSIPFNYSSNTKTGNIINHYYIEIFNKEFTILGKYSKDNMSIKKSLILDKPYLIFKLYKEELIEYKKNNVLLNKEEAYNIGILESDNIINNKLNSDEYIISKNVLKKEVNSSKMYLEVFYKVYENIGVTSVIEEKG